MPLDVGEIQEAESDENTGLFFKYIGAFKAPAGEVSTATALQVAQKNGLLVFRTADGPAILQTPPLIKQLRDAREPLELPEPIHKLPGGPSSSIVLSPSCTFLAVVTGDTVNVYGTAHLAKEGNTDVKPIAREQFRGRTVAQFEFRPGHEASYVVRLDDKSIWRGDLGQTAIQALPAGGSDAIAWSPDGSVLATATGRGRVNFLREGESVGDFAVKSLELQSEDDRLRIHSIVWLRSNAILISSGVLSGGEPEPVAAACVVSWEGIVPDVSNLKLQELFALNIIPALGQDILRSAAIPDWGAEIYSHASAADDHIKVLLTRVDEDTQGVDAVAADIIDDRLAIRVPNGADDADNYVTGLGVDLVGGAGVPVAHPTDPDAPDLAPQPVLWLATSDGCLRAYTFGSITGRPAIVLDSPIPLPDAPAIEVDETPGARSTSKLPPSAAVAASVPLEDSDDLEEDEELDYKEAAQVVPSNKGGAHVTGEDGTTKAIAEEKKTVPGLASAGFASAASVVGSSAAPSAPSSSSLPFGGGSTSAFTFGGLAAGVQQTPATGKPGGLFGGFGASSTTTTSATFTPGPAGFPTATTPGLFAGLPSTPSVFGPPPPTPNITGDVVPAAPKETSTNSTTQTGKPNVPSQPPLPSASQLKQAQALKARVLGTSVSSSSDAQNANVAPAKATGTASKPSQPPLPSFAQVKAAQELRGKVLGSSTTPASGSVAKQPEKQSAAFGSMPQGGSLFGAGTTAPPLSFPKAQQQPSTTTPATQPSMPKKTTIPEPPALLTGSDTIASGIEADFLKSLLASRKLETEVHNAVQECLARADEISVSAGALERCHRGCSEAKHALREQQQTAAKLTESIKDCLRKTAAMPGFLSEKERQKAGIDGTAPLADPALALAGSQLQQQLISARVKLEELTAAVTVLEDRQRSVRLGLEPFDPVKPEQFLELMQTQAEVTARRLEQLEEMKREARRLGLLQLGDEDDQEEEEEEEDVSDGLSLNRELSPLTDAMKRLRLPQLGLPVSSPSSSRRWSLAEDAAPVSSAVGPVIHRSSYGVVSPGLSAETKSRRLAEACVAARVDGEVRIIDLRGTTAKEGQAGTHTLKQKPVALPTPPRLSPEPGTPKPSFDFTSALGSEAGTVPFFKGLAQEQQLSPMPAAKPKTAAAQPASPSQFSTPSQPKTMPSAGVFAASLTSPKQPETTTEEVKPKAKSSSLSTGSQPPLPSMTQLASARALMSKLPGAEAAKPNSQASSGASSSVQESTSGPSASPTAPSQETKATLADNDAVKKDISKDASALSFGALSFGGTASSGTGATKNAFAIASPSGPASSAAFGSTVSSENQKPGALFGSSAGVSLSSAASTPFGAVASSVASSSSAAASTPFGAFGSSSSSSSAAAGTPFGAFGSSAVVPSSSAASTPFGAFGSSSSSSSAAASTPLGAFGSSAVVPSSSAASTPFGAFGSSAGASSSTAAASAPFGAFGSSAGASSSSSAGTPFGAFGSSAPSSSSAAPSTPFGAFGSGAGTAASSPFGAFSKGFGTPSAFGAASTASSSGTGTAPFGQPTPGFGGAIQSGSSGFGQPAAVSSGFGQPAGLGQASAFGAPTAFGGGAASTPAASGFGGGLAFGKSTATAGGGFGALAQGGGSPAGGTPAFGSGGQATPFGGGGFGALGQPTAAPTGFTPPAGGATNMWAPRK